MGPPHTMGVGRGIGRIIGPGGHICLSEEKREKQPSLVCPSSPFPLLFLGFLLSNQGSKDHWALYSCPLPFL